MTIEEYKDDVKNCIECFLRENFGDDWKYNPEDETIHGVESWSKEKTERVRDVQDVEDDMMMSDSVTGNGSGSFYFNAWKAQEALKDVIWDDEFWDYLKEFGYDLSIMERGAENLDVCFRCLILPECLGEFLEDCPEGHLYEEKEEEGDQTDSES